MLIFLKQSQPKIIINQRVLTIRGGKEPRKPKIHTEEMKKQSEDNTRSVDLLRPKNKTKQRKGE